MNPNELSIDATHRWEDATDAGKVLPSGWKHTHDLDSEDGVSCEVWVDPDSGDDWSAVVHMRSCSHRPAGRVFQQLEFRSSTGQNDLPEYIRRSLDLLPDRVARVTTKLRLVAERDYGGDMQKARTALGIPLWE